jgi:hypothetical protein
LYFQIAYWGCSTKGIAIAVALALIVAIVICSLASANPPLNEPIQDESFCNKLKVSGTGTIDIGVSVIDKTIALEYVNVLNGDGDFEYDSTQATAERASNIKATIDNKTRPVNLLDTVKMTYSGKVPLVGTKYIHSNAFYGGIGAQISEFISVTELDKTQDTYFASTDPSQSIQDLIKKQAMRDTSLVHSVGMDTKMSFNGTWVTDAKWHKMFYKNVKIHEAFTGKFDVEKTLRFHENPVPEQRVQQCDGIDC